MKTDDMIIVSVDDHLVEPPDMFDGRLPAKYADHAPKVVRTDDGQRRLGLRRRRSIPNIGLNAVAGRPKEEYGVDPTAFDEMRPGCYDVHERVKDMNAGGVLASHELPVVPGVLRPAVRRRATTRTSRSRSSRPTTTGTSTSGAARTPSASSRWRCRCCGTPSSARQEIRRVVGEGLPLDDVHREPGRARLPELPRPSTGTRCGRALVDEGIDPQRPPRLVGAARGHRARRADGRDDHAAADEHLHGGRRPRVVARVQGVPDLKVALSEGGTGWIPYFLDRLDRTYDMHHLWTGQDFGDKMPSDVFREHFLTCFIADPVGLAAARRHRHRQHLLGAGLPALRLVVARGARGVQPHGAKYDVPDDEINKITHENAMRWYRFDPFAIRPKEQCTVGALRAEAAGHDVSVHSMSDRHKERHMTSLGELAANATAS